MARKPEDDIAWHRTQIARLNEAIARDEPGRAIPKGQVWGSKNREEILPTTLLGMRRQLEHFERRLQELEARRGREE